LAWIIKENLYFVTAETKEVYQQLTKIPIVRICAFPHLQWMRVKGKAVFDASVLQVAVFTAMPG
jgi:uncharacterized pyridoxamine 5'-phosphate oxidase family protein